MKSKFKSPLLIMFLTICIDLVGFGIIIPLSPYLARHFEASGLQVGLLMFTYSFVQFCFAPFWGYLSDRYGRRPIILISLLGSAIAHLFMAFSSELWMLFVARGLAGLFAASVSVATAYIADVTKAADRSKNMGIIGAAFGLGFVLGPAISGCLSYLSVIWGLPHPFGIAFPALGACLICFANLIFAYLKLPESHQTALESNISKKTLHRSGLLDFLSKKHFFQTWSYIRRPVLRSLFTAEMLLTIGMGQMEVTLALFLKEVFSWSLITTSFAFVYVGLVMALTQGLLIRKLMPYLGERRLLFTGVVMAMMAMLAIAFSYFIRDNNDPIYAILVFGLAISVLSVGNGFYTPALLGAVSLIAKSSDQGSVMGVYQSYASIGRILGAVLGGFLFDHLMALPYLSAFLFMFLAMLLMIPIYSKIPDQKQGLHIRTSSKESGP